MWQRICANALHCVCVCMRMAGGAKTYGHWKRNCSRHGTHTLTRGKAEKTILWQCNLRVQRLATHWAERNETTGTGTHIEALSDRAPHGKLWRAVYKCCAHNFA